MDRHAIYKRYNHSRKGLDRRARHVIKLYADPERHAHRRAICRSYNARRRDIMAGRAYAYLPDICWKIQPAKKQREPWPFLY